MRTTRGESPFCSFEDANAASAKAIGRMILTARGSKWKSWLNKRCSHSLTMRQMSAEIFAVGASQMDRLSRHRRIACFGEFQASLQSGELRKFGQRIHLERKPSLLLTMLLERSGNLVSREKLQGKLWPGATHVDFDHSLNIAVAKLRRALSDSVENPRYIETSSKEGYRFIGSVKARQKWHGTVWKKQHGGAKDTIRLAVLPFGGLGTTPEQAHFCDGLSEEIINHLGHLYAKQLSIIARTSTLRYRGTTKSIIRIGQELRVDYVLEGSAHSSCDHMHITAELIRVSNQTLLWANSYDYRLGDIITIQIEVAHSIARSMGFELLLSDQTDFLYQT